MKANLYVFLSLLVLTITGCSFPEQSKEFAVMGYFVPGNDYAPESLPLEKLTHIIYSFTKVIDNKMAFRDTSNNEKLTNLVNQKKNHPNLKVMIACGGWGGSGGFSDMAASQKTRKVFVESVISFINKYNIDGLDIDWEYPGLPGIGNPYRPEDKENFTALMKELRLSMDNTNKKYLLTFAAAGWKKYFDHIELLEVLKYSDYINIMTYDLTGASTPFTTHHTNLGNINLSGNDKSSAIDYFKHRKPNSAEQIIDFVIKKGANPNQIVIGSAFYGRTWKGVPPANNGLLQPNKGYWKSAIAYSEIKNSYENKNGFVKHWDNAASAPFLYNASDSIFISYDDTASVRLKTRYAIKNNLGGIMFWELKHDTKKNGLLNAIYEESTVKQLKN